VRTGRQGFREGVIEVARVETTSQSEADPQVLREDLLWLAVCVPEDWTDAQIEDFANRAAPAGTSHGWVVHHAEGARVPCAERDGYVHVVLMV